MVDKEKYSRIKLKEFQSIFNQTAEVYENPPARGSPREHAVREYLKNHLPRKYGVTTGKVMSRDGRLSRQIDILIYDVMNCPILYSEQLGEEYQIIPADGAIANIEVKSIVDLDTARSIVKNIESFKKEVEGNDKAVAGFFGYATPAFKSEAGFRDYQYNLQDIFSTKQLEGIFKIGCILPHPDVDIKIGPPGMEMTPCMFYIRQNMTSYMETTKKKLKPRTLKNHPRVGFADPSILLSVFMLQLSIHLNRWHPKKYSLGEYVINFPKPKGI
jgi:hypothetical protein